MKFFTQIVDSDISEILEFSSFSKLISFNHNIEIIDLDRRLIQIKTLKVN